MKKAEIIELSGVIASLIFQYGVPAAINIIAKIQKDEITDADIAELKTLVRPPEEYFPGIGK